jgi:hypothetical protein
MKGAAYDTGVRPINLFGDQMTRELREQTLEALMHCD